MLLSCLRESRLLYNEMLALLKAHYEETGRSLSRYDLTYRFKGRGARSGSEHVPQSTIQTLADRLDKALKRFFDRKELGKKVGFPRFKSANRWQSIRLRQYGRGRDVYLDPDTGKLDEGDIGEQTRRCLDNLSVVAAAAGASLGDDAVRCGIYVTDIATFKDVNAAYAGYFGDAPPARSTIGVASLPLGADVEIDAILAVPD